ADGWQPDAFVCGGACGFGTGGADPGVHTIMVSGSGYVVIGRSSYCSPSNDWFGTGSGWDCGFVVAQAHWNRRAANVGFSDLTFFILHLGIGFRAFQTL